MDPKVIRVLLSGFIVFGMSIFIVPMAFVAFHRAYGEAGLGLVVLYFITWCILAWKN